MAFNIRSRRLTTTHPPPSIPSHSSTHIHTNIYSYSATLVNSRTASNRALLGNSASSQSFGGGVKSPFFNANFSMALPAGVSLKSFSSSPKSTTAPNVSDSGLLTWNLNTNVKSGGKLNLKLKLVAGDCTTPDPLALDGAFTYTNEFGTQTTEACLKKPLYVWAKSCPAIPKPGPSPAKEQKENGLGPKESWETCNCTVCKCTTNSCNCPRGGCNCTAVAN